jgi:hypothetical protein
MDAVALRKSGLTSFTFHCGFQQANNVISVKLLARPMRFCHDAPLRQGSRSANWLSEAPPTHPTLTAVLRSSETPQQKSIANR